MTKETRKWLIAAGVLIVVGLVLFCVAMTVNRWEFGRLDTVEYETNTYELSEEFSDIRLMTSIADIAFVKAEDGKNRVECFGPKNARHAVKVQYGTLLIQVEEERAWREYIGLSIKNPKITLCLSETAYESLRIEERTGDIDIPEAFAFGTMNISLSTGDVRTGADVEKQMKITASTGDITVENADAGEVILSASTGKVTLSRVNCAGEMNIHVSTGKTFMTDVRCRSLVSDGTTGDMNLNGVLSAERMHIDRTTGDVEMHGCDAGEMYIKTSTGRVSGSLLTEKVFAANSRTGKISVPSGRTGGICEITTSTGNIIITIE